MNPNKRSKLQAILNVLDGKSQATADATNVYRQSVLEAETKLKDAITASNLDEVNKKISDLQKQVDLTPIKEGLVVLQSNAQANHEEFVKQLEEKYAELEQLSEDGDLEEDRKLQDKATSLMKEISDLQDTFIGLNKVNSDRIEEVNISVSQLADNLKKLATKKTVTDLRNDFETYKQQDGQEDSQMLADLREEIKAVQVKLLSAIGNKGGSMNRKIWVEGVDPLTKWTDINIYGVSSSVITSVDNANKRVNIGIQGGGGGGGGTPNALRVDYLVDPNGTGTHTTLQAAIDAIPANINWPTVIAVLPGSDNGDVTVSGSGKEFALITSGDATSFEGLAKVGTITFSGANGYLWLHSMEVTSVVLPDGANCLLVNSSKIGTVVGTSLTSLEMHTSDGYISSIITGTLRDSIFTGGSVNGVVIETNIRHTVFSGVIMLNGITLSGSNTTMLDIQGEFHDVRIIGGRANIQSSAAGIDSLVHIKVTASSEQLVVSGVNVTISDVILGETALVFEDSGSSIPELVSVQNNTLQKSVLGTFSGYGNFTNSTFGPNSPSDLSYSNITGSGNQIWGADIIIPEDSSPTDRLIHIHDQTNTNTNANLLFIHGGAGNGTGAGGEIDMYAGNGGSNGRGGDTDVEGGNAGGGNNRGGHVFHQAGNGSGTGDGGTLFFTSGLPGTTGSNNSGAIRFTVSPAMGTNGNGGDIFFQLQAGSSGGNNSQFYFLPAGGSIKAILDFDLVGSSDKTFTFPNQSGTIPSPSSVASVGQYLMTTGGGITQWASVVASGGSGITRTASIISVSSTFASASATDYVAFTNVGVKMTLPTAVGNGNLYTVKNTSTSSVLVATTSAQTIDGSATALLNVQNISIDLLSDGSNWNVV